MRHGRRGLWALAFLLAARASAVPAVQISYATLELAYTVNDAALPLDNVTLWYTMDGGANWIEYGPDPDRRSPMTFHASQDGRHGFYFVFRNASGFSGPPPHPGVTPQLSVFVDDTPPAAELHELRQLDVLGKRMVQIRWTAADVNFADRPVHLDYRRLPDRLWALVGDEPLPNTGRYDWLIPDDLSGPVAVRLTVVDRSGRRTIVEPQTLEIQRPRRIGPRSHRMLDSGLSGTPNFASAVPSLTIQEHARRLMAQAVAYRDRGQYPQAISRLREAVKLNPSWADAFVEMGEMLYRIGNVNSALNAYEIALQQQPLSRRALRGAAIVHRRQNDHDSAARLLRTILQADPNDAEVWINLGDISVFQGDELMARECYTRASLVDPAATQVVDDARRRLELMSTVSRTYSTDRK